MAINFEKDRCCGCLACMNICPVGAIEKVKDENGFIYPKVNKDKCIECHLCEKVCHYNKEDKNGELTKKSFSLIINNKKELYNSTSGGAFTVLSDVILNNNGSIFGTILDKDFNVHYTKADNKEERDRMRGSKYVQSDTDFVYKSVKAELELDKQVLFVGTPCHVGGLISYLQKDYPKLLTVEFLCHGVPNNDFFKAHIKYLEDKFNKKAINYTFRSKKYTWRSPGIEEITFENGKTKDSKEVQAYTHFFHDNYSLRPACYDCTYRSFERTADITIADFWGINKLTNNTNYEGASLILANSDKGLDFINAIDKNVAIIEEVNYESIRNNISSHKISSKINAEEFWKNYNENGYASLVEKYTDHSIKGKIKYCIKKETRKFIGKSLKK